MDLRFAICDLQLGNCQLSFVSCQLLAAATDNGPRTTDCFFNRKSKIANCKSAFTLTEMLIVIAIIVLAITLAVPAVRSLTGSRSQAAGQNVISAVLSRARAEAIGLQRVQGVLFFIDPATDRVSMAQVIDAPNEAAPANLQASGVTYLDLTPDHDVVSLPPGIRLQMLKDSASNHGTFTPQFYPTERYLGFNQVFGTWPIPNPSQTPLGGVILFDAQGRLIVRQYGFRFANYPVSNTTGLPARPSVPTALGQLAFQAAPDPAIAARAANQNNGIWPTFQQSASQVLRSQIGFVLFDREAFRTQAGSNGANFNDQNGAIGADKNTWLDQNSTPILVNRYNGTLLRAE